MATTSKPERHAKGVLLIGIVKTLRFFRRQRPLEGLSPAAEAFLNEHVLPDQWYAFDIYRELLNVIYREVLASNDEYALQAGIEAGKAILTTFHKAFIIDRDPLGSLLSMRHIWKSYFDFGFHKAEQVSDRSVRFTVADFPNMLPVHGMMIIGWDIAAAQAAGAEEVKYELLESPWRGDLQLKYLVML
jgi:hypothetical protein